MTVSRVIVPTKARSAGRSWKLVTIAISGPDNVGKSTQIRLLGRRIGVAEVEPLDAYDPRWAHAHELGLAKWWFREVPLEEVVDVLVCSYLTRAASGVAAEVVRVLDRGMPMLEASVVATAAVREGLDYAGAAHRAGELLASYGQDLARARAGEWGVLLLHDIVAEKGAARALAREHSVTPVYTAYQRALNTHLHTLADEGRFAATIVVADRSILDAHQELGMLLRTQLGIPVPDVATRRVRVVALGGLSESGKSTAGAYLASRHGYARLKIDYLLQSAAARCGVTDVYALDEVGIAEMLALGLDTYCAAHHFQRYVSIESLHRSGMTAELGKLLGDRLTVVYLEARTSLREARGVDGPVDVQERDTVKLSRGADEIRRLADVVVDNNGPRVALYHTLDRIAVSKCWPAAEPRRVTVADLGLPTHLAGYLDALLTQVADPPEPLVSLLAVTGSGARGKYQHGWSDLDVLAVAELSQFADLQAALGRVADQLGGVKLGFTVLSAAECSSGVMTPRLLHTLALIGSGRLPVLWCTDRHILPSPEPDTDALASLQDGVAAGIEIRRQLLRAVPDLRSLFKVTALVAKVALRADGEEHPGDAEALEALLDRFPVSFPGLGTDLLQAARSDEQAAVKLARAVLAWWLATLPNATPSP